MGTLPDGVQCIGGAKGSENECKRALEYGSAVLMIMLKECGPTLLSSTYRQSEVMQAAIASKSAEGM